MKTPDTSGVSAKAGPPRPRGASAFEDDRCSNPCPLCGDRRTRAAYVVRGMDIVRCRTCRLHYVEPRLSDARLLDIYRSGYFESAGLGYDDYERCRAQRVKTFARWYRALRPLVRRPPFRALDVGCAAGYFMDLLRADGWRVDGVELDTAMLPSLRERGYRVFSQPLASMTEAGPYAFIALFDVLEHLPQLRADAATLAALLAPGGHLALVTPDINSLQRRLFGARWFQFKPIEHIQYFSRTTLRRLFEPHGLRTVFRRRPGQYADVAFLHRRLLRYGFPALARLLKTVAGPLRLDRRDWYVDTGSLFVLLQKGTRDT